jgi:hypothetical protein
MRGEMMNIILKWIIIIMAVWAGLVSLITGRILLRSGSTQKGNRPRIFGAGLLVVALLLMVYWLGWIPIEYQSILQIIIIILLVVTLLFGILS